MRRKGNSLTMSSRWQIKFYARIATCCIMSLAIMMLVSLIAPAAHAESAGGNKPIIHWDASMIYAGQNNGYPWGPVGENTIVHGANFTPNVQLHLVVSPGDSNADPTVCQQTVNSVAATTVTTDNTGSFTQNFPWPAAASHVNQGYSICSMLASDNSLASSKDDGPFTVLSSSPPVINISATSVAAGGTVTVTGQNWVPPQPVSIEIAGCAACDAGNTYVTSGSAISAGLNSGTFSVAIPIPAATKPGNYVVDALTQTGLEAYYTTGVKHLTITSAPTTPSTPTATPTAPTAQPSPSPSPTAQVTATATTAATPAASPTVSGASSTVTTTTNGSNGTPGAGTSSGNHNRLLLTLIGTAMVFFLIAAAILLVMLRRKRAGSADAIDGMPTSMYSGAQARLPGQSGQFNQNGMFNGNVYGNVHGQPVSAPNYAPPQQVRQQADYPFHYGHSGIGLEDQGSFTPPPSLPSQPIGISPLYGQPHQTGNGFQSYNSMPTEAYDMQRTHNMQNASGQAPNLPTCPNCGRPLVPNLPACGVCGMPLELMRR